MATKENRATLYALIDALDDDDVGTVRRVLEALTGECELVPGPETIAAMEAARRGEFEGKVFDTVEQLFDDLHAKD